MKILALETTERTGGVAAAVGSNVLLELSLGDSQRSAQSLAPAMQTLLEWVGWRPADVRLVAVSRGPGSFTGLRIGAASPKMFAYAVGAALLGIDTLEAVACAAPDDVAELSVVQDAQRGQVVARRFTRRSDGWFEPAEPEQLLDARDWLCALPPGVAVTGPGLVKLAERLPSGIRRLDQNLWRPKAEAVARLAARDHAAGRRDDLWTFAPRYSRPSAAEEKWIIKNASD